jgi:hypothetical protein
VFFFGGGVDEQPRLNLSDQISLCDFVENNDDTFLNFILETYVIKHESQYIQFKCWEAVKCVT